MFKGQAFGHSGTRVGEVVFNTAMTGYQEALTDPSYTEQILIMTTAHVGNTGINYEDPESQSCTVSGFIARKFTKIPSNHRSQKNLEDYLRQEEIPALEGIDTRALVRHLRDKGAMKGALSTDGTPIEELHNLINKWPGMSGRALAQEVEIEDSKIVNNPQNPSLKVNLIDGGCKTNIPRLLISANCFVRQIPISASPEAWKKDCDLVFFSNGPGDPAALSAIIDNIKTLHGKIPLVGICLGHQLLALSLGAKSFKLPFGHRGLNHPVIDHTSGRVEISSQNHGFCIDESSLKACGAEITHHNLNDNTVAGFWHKDLNIMGIQFHPEAAPGPHDSQHLLVERFLSIVKNDSLKSD
ncbi:MAG: carbamoyl phosphate synthase small subunit [Proteobacteria bacterium]|nr:carbamoyl phosphate synthase small subunit [Pseudomonadota bacterium]